MEQIRYVQRICEDEKKVEQFLTEARTGVLGIAGADYPYCVPVNYVWKDGAIYFHGLGSGKKIELLETHREVSFLVYQEHGTVQDAMPCHADTSYISVMLFGKAEKLTSAEESSAVLQAVVDKFMPHFYKNKITPALVEKYRSAFDNQAVAVYKIVPDYKTAKENVAAQEDLYQVKKEGG